MRFVPVHLYCYLYKGKSNIINIKICLVVMNKSILHDLLAIYPDITSAVLSREHMTSTSWWLGGASLARPPSSLRPPARSPKMFRPDQALGITTCSGVLSMLFYVVKSRK